MTVRMPIRKQYLRYLFPRNSKRLHLVSAQNWHVSLIYYDQVVSVKENHFQGICLNQLFYKVHLCANPHHVVGICLTPYCHWKKTLNWK